ncbi:unnamed protein product [Pleuronectes platessa]|uniref:Uncharacterized protein n=1 Tax=Pleuronectes platessa TaxID=8262 RepID=A0A9N7UBS3_PLEPL|nr:unnamed protein product [Pleuronectes platessa]
MEPLRSRAARPFSGSSVSSDRWQRRGAVTVTKRAGRHQAGRTLLRRAPGPLGGRMPPLAPQPSIHVGVM